VQPRTLRRAIAPETAATLTAIMEEVVTRGTGTAADIPGYTVAGKTGTAAKLVNGRYSKSDYNASFVGFVPSRKPALAIVVVIDSPHGRGYYGGTVSAPVFQRIAEASLRHLGVAPTINALPPVLVTRNEGGVAAVPTAAVSEADPEHAVALAQEGLMPDLRGMSARKAIATLARIGLTPRVTGAGLVVEQAPPAGAPLPSGEVSSIRLGRQPLPVAGGASQ
jgi:membrane peptidoglycan carboxypeptidase